MLRRLLTQVSQGYFQPDVGGRTIPTAQGELSDLAGDEPLFKALYKWCAPFTFINFITTYVIYIMFLELCIGSK